MMCCGVSEERGSFWAKDQKRVQKAVLELGLYTRYVLPLVPAYLRDFVGSVADYRNKASHNLFASGGVLPPLCKKHICEVQ